MREDRYPDNVDVDVVTEFAQASTDLRFASAVAAFGMLLRGSQYSGDASWSSVKAIATSALGHDTNGYRTEFLDLVRRAESLSNRQVPPTYPYAHPAQTYPAPQYQMPNSPYPSTPPPATGRYGERR